MIPFAVKSYQFSVLLISRQNDVISIKNSDVAVSRFLLEIVTPVNTNRIFFNVFMG